MARKSETDPKDEGNRIAKVMARAGLCSRREAETWIAAGRVAVNGEVIGSPALDIGPDDRVEVDGRPLPQRERTRLFLYHKPRGFVTTTRDPQGRPTIFDTLPKNLPRLVSVGRLDLNSEGLLLLTNDGGLARALELPQTGWLRRYRARALGHVQQAALDKLRNGITVDGIHYGPVEATVDREQGANTWLTVGIREGKNREVRNVLGALGLKVNRLIRTSFGPFDLGMLREGAIEEVNTHDLRKTLGEHILKEAEVDLSGPRIEREMPRASELPRARRRDRPDREQPQRERAPRGDRSREERPGGRPPRGEQLKGTEQIVGGERVPVKRRITKHFSDTHAWRGGEAPLRRKYRGARHDFEKPAGARKDDTVSDRKGREVKVERYGEKKPESAVEERRGRSRSGERGGEHRHGHGNPRARRSFDRRSGPRPSRPRPKE